VVLLKIQVITGY